MATMVELAVAGWGPVLAILVPAGLEGAHKGESMTRAMLLGAGVLLTTQACLITAAAVWHACARRRTKAGAQGGDRDDAKGQTGS